MTRTSPRASWGLVAVGLLVLGLLAWQLVPWSWVPGGRLVPVSPREVFTAAQVERAHDFADLQRRLGWLSLAISLLVALGLGLTPLGARLLRRLPGPWWLRLVLAPLPLLLVGEVATLPVVYARYRRLLEFGLSEQPLPGWLRDQAVSLLVGWGFAAVLVLAVVLPARRWPRRWPLVTAALGVLLTVLGSFVYPLVVEPLFNRFTPLPDGRLRTEVLALAREEGVPVDQVLVADASRRTTTLNAYVSGFGSTRRIVLYDTLVETAPESEVLAVVAHELGHARHHDVVTGTVLGAGGVVVGVGLLGLLLGRRRLLARAGVEDPGQPEVVALVLALAAAGTFLASPVQNTVSRAIEARADRASLEATGDYPAFEAMQERLALRSLSDPDPPVLQQWWFGSHPTTLQRIGLARALERRGPT